MMKVAFLDRDGVINKDVGYAHKIEQFEFIGGCIEALQLLQTHGFEIIIVTNQSGIGRGYYSEEDYQLLTDWYCEELAKENVKVKAIFHCPHSPEEHCDCRKPKPGLFQQACDSFPINIDQSVMVGDKLSDIKAAKSIGIDRCFLVGDHESDVQTYVLIDSLSVSNVEQYIL